MENNSSQLLRKSIFILYLLFSSGYTASGQQHFSFNGSGLLEQIGLPEFRYNGGNPGYGVRTGIRYSYLRKEKWALAQTVDVLFITKNMYGNSLLFVTQFDYRRKLNNWMFDFQIGPGYSLFYPAAPTYVHDGSEYVPMNKPLRKFNAMSTIALTYAAKKIQPFLAYSLYLEYPFINSAAVILPHQIVEIGVSITIKNENNEK